jgi:transposase
VVERVLRELDPPKRTGRKRIDLRGALDAIFFRLRSGCQWNRLPREFPDDSSVHRTFQRWVRLGVFDRIWAVLLEACEDLGCCASSRWTSSRSCGGSPRPRSRSGPPGHDVQPDSDVGDRPAAVLRWP